MFAPHTDLHDHLMVKSGHLVLQVSRLKIQAVINEAYSSQKSEQSELSNGKYAVAFGNALYSFHHPQDTSLSMRGRSPLTGHAELQDRPSFMLC